MTGPLILLPFMSKKASEKSLFNIILPFIFIGAISVLLIWLIKKIEKKNNNTSVTQYAEGLIYVNKDNIAEIIRWDNVGNVWQDFFDQYFNGIHTHHRRRIKIKLKNSDKKFEFTEKLFNIEDLADSVHNSVTPFLLKSMAKKLKNGEELNFGKITINSEGIFFKRKFLPWNETAGIYLESGYVVITRLSHSSTTKINNALSNISALATSFIGTVQPYAMGGNTVIWKKAYIKTTANPYTLTQLVLNIISKKD
jgi:hypothetical protein